MRACVLHRYAYATLCAFGLSTRFMFGSVFVVVCCCVALLMCSVCTVSYVGGLRDEDQYLLRHSSPALEQDSPHGHLLAHLDCQDREELQRTLHRLENENRWGAQPRTHTHLSIEYANDAALNSVVAFSHTWAVLLHIWGFKADLYCLNIIRGKCSVIMTLSVRQLNVKAVQRIKIELTDFNRLR